MVAISHVVFIDESGTSQPGASIQSLWVSAGLAIPFERSRELDSTLVAERTRLFRSRVNEVKGHRIRRNEMRRGVTAADVVEFVGSQLDRFSAHVWVTATRHGARAPAGFAGPVPPPKVIARQLLIERINGLLGTGRYQPANWLMVWDISDIQELMDFSRAVSTFSDGFSGAKIDPRLYPMVLGGLSHDWGGLQLADVISHLSMHKIGTDLGLADANREKSDAFERFIWPRLQRSATGNVVGWKLWDL